MSVLYRGSGLVAADETGRTVHGRAVPYGQVAEVDDGRGRYRESFAPGAFARSIRERGHKVRLFTHHDARRFPIGRATELSEREDGLYAAFHLSHTRDADEALELVTSGVVDAFSIGFEPLRDRRHEGVVVRTEAALREISLVSFPAYEGAQVAGVRSQSSLSVDVARRRLDLLLKDW